MSPRDAAKELGVSRALLYKLCESGRIRHRRVGFGRGIIQINREDLDEYLASCEVAPWNEVANGSTPTKQIRALRVPDYVPEPRKKNA